MVLILNKKATVFGASHLINRLVIKGLVIPREDLKLENKRNRTGKKTTDVIVPPATVN